MISVILFDFDGVIKESVNVKTNAFASMFSKFGDDVVSEVIKYHLENGGKSRFQKLEYYYRELLNISLTSEELNHLALEFSELVKQNVINSPYVKGADQFLSQYSNQFKCFIVTGTPTTEMKDILKSCRILDYFIGVFGSPQEKVEIIDSILKKNAFDSRHVVMVGDSLTDYEAAIANQIHFIGRDENLQSKFSKNVLCIPDLVDLYFYIKQM